MLLFFVYFFVSYYCILVYFEFFKGKGFLVGLGDLLFNWRLWIMKECSNIKGLMKGIIVFIGIDDVIFNMNECGYFYYL